MDETDTAPPGVFTTLRRVAATVAAIVDNRLELLLVELKEERVHAVNAVLLVAVVVALGAFTLAMTACALSIVVWHAFGVEGLWALSGVGLLGTLLAYWRLRTRLRNWPLLPETLAQLRKDGDCLREEP
jgi:uncharacterized membrane protein YqjE